MKKTSLLLILPFLALGCNKSPYDRTTGGVITGSGTGPAAGSLVIYYNELSSGGGEFEYPVGAEVNQSVIFTDSSDTSISNLSMRHHWNGQPASGNQFAGFSLMHTPTLATYASTPGVNLTARGFTKVTFFARGTLDPNTVIKIEVADDGDPSTLTDPCLTLYAAGNAPRDLCSSYPLGMPVQALTPAWVQYRMLVPNAVLANVKDYFKATFDSTVTTGTGGTVFFDRIEYEP